MGDRRTIDRLIAGIQKDFAPNNGKPVIQRGSDVPSVPAIPACTPMLGYVLQTGGWPRGKLVEIFGQEHSGKTTLALLGLRDVYEYEKRKRVVAYIDVEHRFNPDWARKLGLEVDENLLVVQPEDAEDATDIMVRLIRSGEICAALFDSVGGAMTKAGTAEFAERAALVGGNAQVMSRNVRVTAPIADIHDVTVFYLNQLRADMEGYHRPMTPGGHAVKHMMSVRIYLRAGKDKFYDRIGEEKVQVGYRMFFKTVKNSFGAPFREGSSDFFFTPCQYLDHVGFDTDADLQTLGLALGIITRAGAVYSFGGEKAQGREAFFKHLRAGQGLGLLRKRIAERLDRGPDAVHLDVDGRAAEPLGPDISTPEV